jgi:putative aldouronate transport system permease protein
MSSITTRENVSGMTYIEAFKKFTKREWRTRKYIYLMSVPVLAFFIIFRYIPMYGVVIAFKQFSPRLGIFNSPWVGFQHFEVFFNSFYTVRIIQNTILLNLYSLLINFPAPIILALLLNEVRHVGYRRAVQTITYMPFFISLVVIAGLIRDFVQSDGPISLLVQFFGGPSSNLLTLPHVYRPLYVLTDTWQFIGFNSIIYMAAISAVDMELYEAGAIDGLTTRLQRIWYITLPSILPTIAILLILQIGSLMSLGMDKTILLYNDSIMETADIISTFVFRRGLLQHDFSYAAAVGLFNSVINCALLIIANKISGRLSGSSLW